MTVSSSRFCRALSSSSRASPEVATLLRETVRCETGIRATGMFYGTSEEAAPVVLRSSGGLGRRSRRAVAGAEKLLLQQLGDGAVAGLSRRAYSALDSETGSTVRDCRCRRLAVADQLET